jgi:hypothetical protein
MRIILKLAGFGEPICRCPNCRTQQLARRWKRDHIDRLSHSPWSMLQRVLGAQLYHCRSCRLQFYDWRPLRVESPSKARAMSA